jgi:hypothetical protein
MGSGGSRTRVQPESSLIAEADRRWVIDRNWIEPYINVVDREIEQREVSSDLPNS